MKLCFRFDCAKRLSLTGLIVVITVLTGVRATWAQGPAAQAPQPGDVDLSVSRVFVRVGKIRLGHEHAVKGLVKSGKILLGAPQNAGVLVFDMNSFDADGADAHKYVGLDGEMDANTRRQVNESMHGASILNTTKFPTATYQIDSALPAEKAAGDKNGSPYLLKGTLTLVGVSQPLVLRCEVAPHGNQQRVRTAFILKQTDYGITPLRKALGAVGVTNELSVYGDIIIAANQP